MKTSEATGEQKTHKVSDMKVSVLETSPHSAQVAAMRYMREQNCKKKTLLKPC